MLKEALDIKNTKEKLINLIQKFNYFKNKNKMKKLELIKFLKNLLHLNKKSVNFNAKLKEFHIKNNKCKSNLKKLKKK